MTRGLRVVLGALAVAAMASPALAQSTAQAASVRPRTPRVDIAIQGAWIGPVSFGESSMDLLRPDGSPLTVFRSENRLASGLGTEVHVAFPARQRLTVELSGTWTRADLESRISGDIEDAEDVTVSEALDRVTAEGSLVWTWRTTRRTSWFVRGGAGWMREMAARGLLREDGVIVNAGAGLRYWWRERPRGALRRLGLRFEGRASIRSSGLSLGEQTSRIAPVFSGGLILGF